MGGGGSYTKKHFKKQAMPTESVLKVHPTRILLLRVQIWAPWPWIKASLCWVKSLDRSRELPGSKSLDNLGLQILRCPHRSSLCVTTICSSSVSPAASCTPEAVGPKPGFRALGARPLKLGTPRKQHVLPKALGLLAVYPDLVFNSLSRPERWNVSYERQCQHLHSNKMSCARFGAVSKSPILVLHHYRIFR